MQLDTVIFDMDGLLIDSEPLWNEAAAEVFGYYGKKLTPEDYATTTGLRTSEFVAWWLRDYKFDNTELEKAGSRILELVDEKIRRKGKTLPGVHHIINFFNERNFKIGIATSSPLSLVKTVTEILRLEPYLHAITSAEFLQYGKPHPHVYLNCAEQLNSSPLQCICFEDSVNGMIAVKAARMKCVVVPEHSTQKSDKWSLADLKLSSLQNFNELHFNLL
ncbi:MAG: hexitol phosphatase HxpB [Chitinophagaceae bacterium]|nr:hexitol phosphatase HxpB [Chitinophagaceae bacterium]